MNALEMLQSVAGFVQSQRTSSADKPNRLATIDPAYVSGRPKVTFDGETTLSGKQYPYASTYTPVAGHRVVLIPVGTTYLILSRVL